MGFGRNRGRSQRRPVHPFYGAGPTVVALTDTQERNFRAALSVTDDPDKQVRLAFAIWTESRGLIYANGGLNTSHSPGVTPAIAVKLRESLNIPHDAIGNNGRSTGILQQISKDVGGGWGDLAGTMDPADSARRFLAVLHVTGISQYSGTLLTPTGSMRVTIQLSDPIAADVLRVQQPLADEAASSNYGAGQVAIAKQIVAQLAVNPAPTDEGWFDMAVSKDEVRDAFSEANAELATLLKGVIEQLNALNQRFQALADYEQGMVEQLNAVNTRLDSVIKNTAKS